MKASIYIDRQRGNARRLSCLRCLVFFAFIVAWSSIYAAGGAPKINGYLVPDDYFGLHIHNADLEENWPVIAFDSWRLWDAYVSWPHIQPEKTRWDFRKLDKFVKRSEELGIELVLPLGLSPTWASARPTEESAYKQPGWAAEPADMEYWRVYVRTIMERYRGRIKDYEIWNEPNLERFFSGSVEEMVHLTCEAYSIARSIDEEIRIISPAATRMNKGIRWLEAFLRDGGVDCIDIVGFHFYVNAHDEPEQILRYAHGIRKVMKRFHIESMPLWNTETGWYFAHAEGKPDIKYRILDLNESANYLMRAFILGAGNGFERFFWFSWNSSKMGGLVEPRSKAPKKAAYAFAVARQWLRRLYISPCRESSKVWICDIENQEGQKGIIAWTTNGSKTIPNTDIQADSVAIFNGRESVLKPVGLDRLLLVNETPRLFLRQAITN